MNPFQELIERFDRQARKHELGADYAEDEINDLTNYELVEQLADIWEEQHHARQD